MGCEFCWALEQYKRVNEFTRKHPEYYGGVNDRPITECTAVLLIKSWSKKSGKRNATERLDYRYAHTGYKINYCPECGRKIKGGVDDGRNGS